ncbi:hypothetical protein N9954_03425 [Maribacter sp.]|nr:hypothetical protein [Maribacter sp.]
MSKSNYIRFTGHLYPNMQFEFKPGWETDKISHLPEPNMEEKVSYRVSLLDKEGVEIVGVSPEVKFETSCGPNGNEMGYSVVLAYLPLNPNGVQVVFKRGEYLIYSRPLDNKPPQVKITEFGLKKNTVFIQWESKSNSDTPLTYNLVYVVDKKRFFTLARNYTKTAGEFDISTFPGAKSAHVAVLASDGLRSGFAISKKFQVPDKPHDIFILKPGPGEIFSFGEHITFCGRAHDIAGATIDKKSLVWKLNNKVIIKGVDIGVIDQPESGSYVLSLEAVQGTKIVAKKEIKIEVRKQNKSQKRYFELLKDIDTDK